MTLQIQHLGDSNSNKRNGYLPSHPRFPEPSIMRIGYATPRFVHADNPQFDDRYVFGDMATHFSTLSMEAEKPINGQSLSAAAAPYVPSFKRDSELELGGGVGTTIETKSGSLFVPSAAQLTPHAVNKENIFYSNSDPMGGNIWQWTPPSQHPLPQKQFLHGTGSFQHLHQHQHQHQHQQQHQHQHQHQQPQYYPEKPQALVPSFAIASHNNPHSRLPSQPPQPQQALLGAPTARPAFQPPLTRAPSAPFFPSSGAFNHSTNRGFSHHSVSSGEFDDMMPPPQHLSRHGTEDSVPRHGNEFRQLNGERSGHGHGHGHGNGNENEHHRQGEFHFAKLSRSSSDLSTCSDSSPRSRERGARKDSWDSRESQTSTSNNSNNNSNGPSTPVLGARPSAAKVHALAALSSFVAQNQSGNSTASIPSALTDSPVSKMKFKSFYRKFWVLSRDHSPKEAFSFALTHFDVLPKKLHWRVCLEIADLAKRRNKFHTARKWYKRVNILEPCAPQGWLERAKMEEECGELTKCQDIMGYGLKFCANNESLMVKAIKHLERMGLTHQSRAVLATLRDVNIDKVWRTILEGALLEARAGKATTARRIFKYLMRHVSWYGPIYLEACKFEERQLEPVRALAVAERGLKEVPRYGPLWFTAFRLYARLDNGDLTRARKAIEKAATHISTELIWKVYLEASGLEQRAAEDALAIARKRAPKGQVVEGDYSRSRLALAMAIKHCPNNLNWKAWLAGCRLELRCGREDVARALLDRALKQVPKKMRALVLLECSRLEEFVGNTQQARAILIRAKLEAKYEWKVYLESILVEIRAGNIQGALAQALEALEIHQGTGRLWAILIQLRHMEAHQAIASSSSSSAPQMTNDDLAFETFREAINTVPKSGEVWCEGARMMMSPLSRRFNLKLAQHFLRFAIAFTPQYGDSFIEYLRLRLLVNGVEDEEGYNRLSKVCVNSDPNYGAMWFYFKKDQHEMPCEVLNEAKGAIVEDLHSFRSLYQRAILKSWRKEGNPSTGSTHASSSSSSCGSSPLKQTKTISEAEVERWRLNNISSLVLLYPPLATLNAHQRHDALFASDPIP